MKYEVILAETSHLGREGQRVELSLTPADVHVSEEISTYLAGYNTPGYRADEITKPILVEHDSDKYRTFDSDDTFQRVKVKIGPSTPPPRIDTRSSLTEYKVIDRAVASFIPVQTESNATKALRPRQAAARRCKRAIQMDREFDVLGTGGLLSTSTNYASGQRKALTAAEKWNGGASSDPIANLLEVIDNSYGGVTDLWMNFTVARHFIQHDRVRDHIRFHIGDSGLAGQISGLDQAVRGGAMFDFVIPMLPPIHVCAAKAKDASAAVAQILPSTIVIATVSPPGIPTDGEDIATSYTYRRKGPSGVGFEMREYFEEQRGPYGGTVVVASMADIAVITGSTVGGIITGVTA